MWVHKSWFNKPRSLKSTVNIGNIILFKGTVNLISSDSTGMFDSQRFLLNLSLKSSWSINHVLMKKLNWFHSKVTCGFLLQKQMKFELFTFQSRKTIIYIFSRRKIKVFIAHAFIKFFQFQTTKKLRRNTRKIWAISVPRSCSKKILSERIKNSF